MLQNRASRKVTSVLALAALLSLMGIANDTATGQQRRKSSGDDSKRPATASEQARAAFSVRITNIVQEPLAARVRLLNSDSRQVATFDAPEGSGVFRHSPGRFTVLVDVYDDDVPILVHMQQIDLADSSQPDIAVALLEGSGSRNLRQFDRDLDLALDRLEVEQGTDPTDARDTPGEASHAWQSPVLSTESRWYRGELHAYSDYGPGSESVGRLIKRAESDGLDFLAITDPNSLESALDPDFKSSKVVLIPAMEWGDAERGTALVYAPGETLPLDVSPAEAQALAVRLQARGGLFVVAHPAVPNRTWNWGLSMFNGVEVWWKEWRQVPPIQLGHLSEQWRVRDESGDFVYAMAAAAATQGLSGNAQSTIFYDMQVTHLAKAAVIAGSGSTGRKEQLASPVTYVYGREKSLKGILEGIRKGRTYVSKGLDGPLIEFQADIMADGTVDVGMGGIIPINVKTRLIAGVSGAKGGRIDILMNGYPVRSRPIDSDKLTLSLEQIPDGFGAFRMRIVGAPDKEGGYGFSEMLAMSSPIYAQSYFVEGGRDAGRDGWVEVESDWQEPLPGAEFDPSKLDPSQIVTLEPR